jgi:hypothetical protein
MADVWLAPSCCVYNSSEVRVYKTIQAYVLFVVLRSSGCPPTNSAIIAIISGFFFFFFFFFFCGSYIQWWTLTFVTIACRWSRFCDFRLQFLTPIVFTSSSTESSHLIAGLPTHQVPSALRRVNFLQEFCSCILKRYPPSHLNRSTLITSGLHG